MVEAAVQYGVGKLDWILMFETAERKGAWRAISIVSEDSLVKLGQRNQKMELI